DPLDDPNDAPLHSGLEIPSTEDGDDLAQQIYIDSSARSSVSDELDDFPNPRKRASTAKSRKQSKATAKDKGKQPADATPANSSRRKVTKTYGRRRRREGATNSDKENCSPRRKTRASQDLGENSDP